MKYTIDLKRNAKRKTQSTTFTHISNYSEGTWFMLLISAEWQFKGNARNAILIETNYTSQKLWDSCVHISSM